MQNLLPLQGNALSLPMPQGRGFPRTLVKHERDETAREVTVRCGTLRKG